MKKRERTQNLIKESEQLDTQNLELKNQVRALETERRKLLEMLQGHTPSCVRRGGLNLPSKLLQSPAQKFLAELDMEENVSAATSRDGGDLENKCNGTNMPAQHQARTAIPPMSTIKFSRANNFKAAAVVAAGILNSPASSNLPNGYCKPSPSAHELGYLNSPSQESMCLPSLQASTPTGQQTSTLLVNGDYLSQCDSDLSVLGLQSVCNGSSNSGGDSSALLASVASPLSAVSTPTNPTNEFVKNELVDSQSPYTTAQSAERFLFETHCDSYVDIKHAVSLHPGSHNNNNNSISHLSHNNNNSNLLDFHSMSNSHSIAPFHDQLSIKNDYLHDSDLLALTLSGDAGEFVDLDTGVAASFLANGGCLA